MPFFVGFNQELFGGNVRRFSSSVREEDVPRKTKVGSCLRLSRESKSLAPFFRLNNDEEIFFLTNVDLENL